VRLLFDQNISARIIRLLKHVFPDCTQVTLEGLSNANDLQIWEWARQNNCCIITFDSDFLDILTLRGFPPKILLLRLGNRRTNELAEILSERKPAIDAFLADKTIGCLEIYLADFR
jgi:predicted nuclease of predicted toxin-antitoxin system